KQSQCSAQILLAFNRLEQSLEVSLAEAAGATPLDHLEEQRRPIGDRLGENLQHVAFVVPIDQDAKLGQVANILLNGADTLRQGVVIRLGHAQERDVI